MHKWLLAALLAGALHGAVIRGSVVENQTGHPLSRASVLLEPVPGSPGVRMTAHTNQFGFFEFAGASPGTYLLQASRAAFVTALYGQKRWNSAGMPLIVSESELQFLTIRMLRFGSIAGRVVDENDVGVPEFEVAAYLNTRPPQLVAKATSDDKGMYRIYGLLPGNYVVRTVGKQVDDIGYKPTYARETDLLDQARAVDVEIEQQVEMGNLQPLQGKLFTLTASVRAMDPIGMPVTMTFASETGRQIIHSDADFVLRTFTGLPAGDYEVFGEAPSDTPLIQGDFQRISIGRDSTIFLPMRKVPMVTFRFDGVSLQAANDGTVQVMARRKDLAGVYDARIIKGTSARLAPGRWELALAPLDGYYVSGFSGSGNYGFRRNQHVEGWNEITVTSNGGSARFTISSNVSSLHGLVKDAGDPVVGAPVFLEPIDLEPERRVTFTYIALTDTHGQYQFAGLAPGRYRVLSSFEYQMPEAKIMENAGAKGVQLDPRADVTRDLDLYVIR
jgi:hypothetical protein